MHWKSFKSYIILEQGWKAKWKMATTAFHLGKKYTKHSSERSDHIPSKNFDLQSQIGVWGVGEFLSC